ncbi:SDR family oxidoreductase [Sphingobacterium sp. JB170]|uniref:SDR family oxidoreductase n=1 Tax=Sphingobacterium sp. JB170 TaxID=1434842 RepID=UPI00097E8A49|nr:SDR family oxidoreductase [Sphingobacterium sp. JB170]SJN47829.1 Nucleoside-diphosphate-sugar epimerases [Sphingobacterium sp. JB170]
MDKIALVVGVTGLTGANLAQELVANGWQTYGLARTPKAGINSVSMVKADLLDKDTLKEALVNISPTHVFITTWMRKDTEAENVLVNGTMVRNLLEVLSEKKSVEHVALVTGLKHYLGPFEAFASKENMTETPLREEQPRLNLPNFYYAQEDEVYHAAQRDGFSWSVHRPHTVIGKAIGNLMNMGTTLAVYASICKYKGQKFIWPGSEAQWEGLSDVTDAGILAKQLIWASTTAEAKNTAYNIVNGDIFRWKWLWERIANHFGLEYEGFNGSVRSLDEQMRNDSAAWDAIVKRNGLEENELYRLTSPWHTDLDLGRPIEVMTDMSNSRRLGFKEYQNTEESFINLFEKLRVDKIIP